MNDFITIMIGNGLGRAIENNEFKLSTGIDFAWEQLSSEERAEIRKIIGIDDDSIPESESEMQLLHEVLFPLRKLIDYAPEDWLTEDAVNYPEILNRFILNVAWYFFDQNYDHDDDFVRWRDHLVSRIEDGGCVHIATLNYDGLLYKHFIDDEIHVCKGYSGWLLDGFRINEGGFHPSYMDRMKHNWNMGFYLHLHGSPLFVEWDNGSIKKQTVPDVGANEEQDRHIVLAHPHMKPDIINGSHLLSEYLKRLREALSESRRLLIIGYGGNDKYLNEEIKTWINRDAWKDGSRRKIVVVERRNGRSKEQREEFWRKKLLPKKAKDYWLTVWQESTILDYRMPDWL